MENTNNAGQTQWIELKSVVIPEDARWHSPEDIDAVAGSMAKNGQLQEIVVCPLANGHYEVRAGVGRTLAAQKLGWEKIRCNIRSAASDYDKRMLTFVENEDREDASPIYQAQLLNAMKGNMTGRDLANKLGKNEDWVASYLGLLKFSPSVQKSLIQIRLNMSQLRAILALDGDKAQLKAAQELASGTFTVPESKAIVKKHLEAQGKAPKTKNAAKDEAGFHFAWKNDLLTVRGSWIAKGKGYSTLSGEFESALSDFLDKHPAEAAKQAVAA